MSNFGHVILGRAVFLPVLILVEPRLLELDLPGVQAHRLILRDEGRPLPYDILRNGLSSVHVFNLPVHRVALIRLSLRNVGVILHGVKATHLLSR